MGYLIYIYVYLARSPRLKQSWKEWGLPMLFRSLISQVSCGNSRSRFKLQRLCGLFNISMSRWRASPDRFLARKEWGLPALIRLAHLKDSVANLCFKSRFHSQCQCLCGLFIYIGERAHPGKFCQVQKKMQDRWIILLTYVNGIL